MRESTKSFPDSAPPTRSLRPGARTALWVCAIVMLGCGIVWNFAPLADASSQLAAIPRAGTDFSSVDFTLTAAERQAFANVGMVHRHYRMAERDFYVTVLDGTRDRHVVHDPQYCFRGAGWQVVKQAAFSVPGGSATWVRAEREGVAASAVFWFVDAGRRYASPLRYWWRTAWRRATLGRSGPEPVLVVMQSRSVPDDAWPALTREVIARLGL